MGMVKNIMKAVGAYEHMLMSAEFADGRESKMKIRIKDKDGYRVEVMLVDEQFNIIFRHGDRFELDTCRICDVDKKFIRKARERFIRKLEEV